MKKLIFLILILFHIEGYATSILILNSYHKGYEWSDYIIKGMENDFYKDNSLDVNILYMDSKRVTSKEYYDNLEKLYEVQLKNRKYDLVIALDRFAYDFVLSIYHKFFKDEPILAVGLENFSYERAKKYGIQNKVSVLLEKRDLRGNIDIIKKIFPQVEKLYIINDKSENALHTEPLIYDLINNTKEKFELKYLKEDNLQELKEHFSVKEKNSVALFVRMYKNSDGTLNKNREIGKFISDSKIPIFVTDSIFIKRGALGGKIVDLDNFGKEAAKMAFDVLSGKVNEIVDYDNLINVFDYEKLNQFSASLKNIEDPYSLINKKETFFDKYRGFIDFVFTISPFFILLILGLIHNIYMRKQVEKDLRRRIEFDETLLNAIDSPIFWQDFQGVIVDSNKTFCELLKLTCKDLYGKKLEDFRDNRYVRKIIRVIGRYKQNENENYEFSYIDDNLKKRTYLVKQEKFKDEKTKSEGFVTIFTDITKEKEIALEKQKNRQFVIQQSKLAEIGEVFSSIAHQWKSPLVEITAIAQELFYTKKCKDVKEDESFVKDIMNQVTYMTRTINDFQKFIMPSNEKTNFNIKEAIESMLEIVHHNMKYNNIKISLDIKEGTNPEVYGYKNEFMQSCLNIVNNAKDALLNKDYKDRKIDIKLFNEKQYLVITIKDNAGGIKNKNVHKIFEPYFTTKIHGHGIGLYMTKVIIEDKMDGKIFVKNKDGGAMFTIKLEQNR